MAGRENTKGGELLNWKPEAERLYKEYYNDPQKWAKIADELASCFPGTAHYEIKEKIRRHIRNTSIYQPAKMAEAPEKSSFEYHADGSIISEKFITLKNGQNMTPEFLLEAHGLKISAWEIVSYKNNFWNSQLKGGQLQISYQSKLTAKPRTGGVDLAEIDKHFDELDRQYTPPVILPARQSGNLIAEVNIADLHLGRLSWHGDTGENYDYKIARDIYHQCISDVCHRLEGREIEYISFPLGNDLLNSDTPDKTTTAGTPQSTDIRWQKMINVTTDMVIDGLEMLKTIAPVRAFYVASNHDEVSTYGIVNTVKAWYRNDDRVEIDRDAISRKYRLYGNTLVGYSHGYNEKPCEGSRNKIGKLAANMPVEAPQMWAQSKYREFHAAHLHSEHALEETNGVIVRRISSPTAADTWTFENGYVGAVRKIQSFIYDKEHGVIEIINTPI